MKKLIRMTEDINGFDFFLSRLHFIEVTDNPLMNMKLWHYLSVFESHIYGIFLQYNRIKTDLKFPKPDDFKSSFFGLRKNGFTVLIIKLFSR